VSIEAVRLDAVPKPPGQLGGFFVDEAEILLVDISGGVNYRMQL
jgi:hypothetical protein